MDAIKMLLERRSVRKYKDEKVDRALLQEIVDIARFAPSWANFQVARYTVVDNAEVIARIANEGVHGFSYNMDTLKNTKGLVVMTILKGKSGKKPGSDEFVTAKGDSWGVFDAGIACQTFCLAAHAKGVGTCVFGIIDDESIGKIIDLPENETVAAIITFGYPDESPEAPKRKETDKLLRFI